MREADTQDSKKAQCMSSAGGAGTAGTAGAPAACMGATTADPPPAPEALFAGCATDIDQEMKTPPEQRLASARVLNSRILGLKQPEGKKKNGRRLFTAAVQTRAQRAML